MDINEYNIVKDYSYEEYCSYLKNNKYGKCEANYGSIKNKRPGYFIHHIGENKIASLSNINIAKESDPIFQTPEMLCYCDYLEHLFLHILIGESDAGQKNLGLDGAYKYIVPALRVFFETGAYNKNIDYKYYELIKNDLAVFNLLLARYNKIAGDLDDIFEWNLTAYKQLTNYLDTIGKAILDLGTCGGKTTTALKYLTEHNCRGLVLCPTKTIKNNWKQYDICDAYTYSGFANKYKTINYSEYGLVILDETHHIGYDEETDKGAKVWSKAIKYILDNKLCKLLGLTATTERSDGIDLAKTIFKDCVVKGKTVAEMIRENILHPFSYITALYNVSELVEKYKAEYAGDDAETKKLLGQLDLAKDHTKSIDSILLEYTQKQKINKPKGLVFVSPNRKADTENTIDEARSIIKKAFPNVEVRVLYSDDDFMHSEAAGCTDNSKNKEWFDNTSEGFIITINQAGEGWHPTGINMLVMFRKTNSFLVFTQQLGRVMTLTKYANPNAIVFDLVNNIDNVEYKGRVHNKKLGKKSEIATIINALEIKKSDQVIVESEAREIVEALENLKDYSDNSWEDWEIEILKQYYPTEGAEGCQRRIDEEWEKRHPGSLTNIGK